MIAFTIAFLCIIALIIRKPGKFTEGGTALLGLFFLILITLLGWPDIPSAIVGTELFRPFHIVVILMSLAVISTSLDDYGFFKYASHRAILWSKNNGKVLFRNFFILTILLTTFTSNDVDVLTVTPIILWFAMTSKINPFPYLISVFVVANTSSMEFLIGNLTNIVIGTVFQLDFTEFFLVMVVPTIITLFVQFLILRLIFHRQLPDRILKPDELKTVQKKLESSLVNKKQNIFLLTVLGLVIVGSVLSDFLPIELWMVALLGALVILFSNEFDVKERLRVIPWDVAVFVLVFIVLTNKLQTLGVVDYLASFFAGLFTTHVQSVYVSGLLGGVISGIINNIPASISLSSALHTLAAGLDVATSKAIAYGLVVGTNLGALFTPVGALATIMWLNITRRKGFAIPIKKLLGYGLTMGIISVFVASSIIAIEFILFY